MKYIVRLDRDKLHRVNQRRENEFGELGNGGRVGMMQMDFPGGEGGKEPACQCGRHKRCEIDPWVGKIPWRRRGNPLQYSCLGNPMDRGAWRAIVHASQRVGHN